MPLKGFSPLISLTFAIADLLLGLRSLSIINNEKSKEYITHIIHTT